MSIVETLTRGRMGRPPLPDGREKAPAVKAKLDEAIGELDGTNQEFGEAAYAATTDEPGGMERLAAIKARREAIGQKIAVLRAAHEAAEAADQKMFAELRLQMTRTQVSAVKRHLGTRDEEAIAFTKAIEAAYEHYTKMHVAAGKAQSALQALQFTDNTTCTPDELFTLVEQEMWRIGGSSGTFPKPRLPGGKAPNFQWQENPSMVPPLTETLAQATDRIMRTLTTGTGRRA